MKANQKRLLLLCATIGVTLFVAFAPGTAAAGSPNDTQYDNPSSSEPTNVNGGGAAGGTEGSQSGAAGVTKTSGTLPFTGQDLVLVVGFGGLLILAGLGLRVVARGRRDS
jgi:hypothetical protein